MREQDVTKQVQEYLDQLGYSRYQLSAEVRTNYNERIDLVVYSNQAPYIAVEIKSDEKLFNTRSSEDLLFNPYVRQTQAYAMSLHAPYYLLTNGTSFLWFTTDDAGRPELLASPVLSPDNKAVSDHDVVRLLQNLRDFFFKNGVSFPRDEAAIIIYAKLLYEYGDSRLEEGLINSGGIYNLLSRSELINIPLQEILRDTYFARRSSSDEDERKRTYYAHAFEIVNRMTFRDVTPQVLLSALDKAFIGEQIRQEGPRVPRWLADFLVRLSQIQKEDVVLDMYCNFGDIAAAVLLASEREQQPFNHVFGISPNATSALWAQIQQLIQIRGSSTNNILVGNTPPYDIWNVEYESLLAQENQRPTRIIAAPPFGARFDTREAYKFGAFNGLKQSEDLYLDLAMNWVQDGGRVTAIVPEGLLVSGNRRNIRGRILSQMYITAIISLGTFLPHTKIKSSILVLDKKRSLESSETFFYHIGEVSNADTFDSRSIPQVAQALTAFEQWSAKQQPDTTPNSMIVPSNRLNIDNLSFSHFMKTSTATDDSISKYATAQLGELTTTIQRGSSKLTFDPDGHLPVIGPAMIRPMLLDPEQFDHTSKDKVPPNAPTVQRGDIVLHGVGTYAGAAALVEESLQDLPINRNVFLIRPDPNLIIPEFLAIALNSSFVSSQIESTKRGTTIQALTVSNLPNIIIPVPSIAIQRLFIDRMRKARDELFQAQDRLKSAEQAFTSAINNLSGWELE